MILLRRMHSKIDSLQTCSLVILPLRYLRIFILWLSE